MNRILNRRAFSLRSNPWAGMALETTDVLRVATMMLSAVHDKAWISLLGPRGAGKSHAVEAALKGQDVQIIAPLRLTRDRLHMGDIETALIRDLSQEHPRRSGEARSHQVRRILGTAAQKGPVVLIIDDAHVLHHQTLRALKRLREMSWLGRAPLLGIVLIGQRDRGEGIDEVRLRSDSLWLEGLSADEITTAINEAMGEAFDGAAIDLVANNQTARNWLDLQALVDTCLARARARGLKQVDTSIVQAVTGTAKPAPATPVPDEAAISRYLEKAKKGRAAA